jgi:hypothetical protein
MKSSRAFLAFALLAVSNATCLCGCGPDNTVEIPDQPAPMPTEEPAPASTSLPAGGE